MNTEKEFFEKFDEASWEVTYGHLDNMDYNVLQVGLTAVFYISEGWYSEKREAMANAIERYIDEFGDKLRWGFLGNVNSREIFCSQDNELRKKRLMELEDDAVETQWNSGPGIEYVSDYQIKLYSPAGWYEYIHGRISYIRFFLPVSELKNDGRERFETLILDFCQLLQPMHGLAGLGTQQLYDDNSYQYLECEIAQNFNCVDITTSLSDKGLRKGIRSVNWFTILSDEWIEKAGGRVYLGQQFEDSNIKILPYNGGVAIRAGEWPELGWVEKDAKPELYVKVNQVLQSIRTPSFGSFHLGSNAGEIRLNETLTAEWQKRFDVDLSPMAAIPTVKEQVRITCWTGEIAPYSGQWAAIVNGTTEYIQIQEGQKLPEFEDKYGKKHRARWSLLKRDDCGSVFKPVEE
jgi:hypothetical protein